MSSQTTVSSMASTSQTIVDNTSISIAIPSTSSTHSHHSQQQSNKQQSKQNNEQNTSNTSIVGTSAQNTNTTQQQTGKKRKSGGIGGASGGRSGGGGGAGAQTGDGIGMWTRLTGAPAWDLQPNDTQNQTFTGRCRLFVANLPSSVTEESLRALFEPFGAVSEIYIGKGNTFAFVKMDTRLNAESAKQSLDGRPMDNRTLRVRLAAHAAAIRVTNLPPMVSNELLYLAFSSFGLVERAIVSADDRGRSVGEGIVEFARKSSASAALKKCQNECLLLSSSPIPVVVTSLESRDEEEGVPEKSIIHSTDYRIEREIGPRFSEPGSLEWEMARKWKQLSSIEQQRRESLESEIRDARDALKSQMEYLKIDETIKQLRERLRQMETQSKNLCEEREQRIDEERRREEQRRTQELVLRQQEEALLRRGHDLDADVVALRRQESELRQQANALQSLLDRQEQALRQMNTPLGGVNVNDQSLQPIIHSQQYSQSQISGLIEHQNQTGIMFSGVGTSGNTSGLQQQQQSQHHSSPYGSQQSHSQSYSQTQQQTHHSRQQQQHVPSHSFTQPMSGQHVSHNIRHSIQSHNNNNNPNNFKRFRR